METNNSVPFDPGFYKFSVQIPQEASYIIDEIAKIKKFHQKKFEFQKVEMRLTPILKNCIAIYIGCILWGSYLYHRHKDKPRDISGNIMKKVTKEKDEYTQEVDFVAEFTDKLDKASNYYLRRPPKAGQDLIQYCDAYREFITLNDNFKNTDRTDQIKLPREVSHFENYDNEKLDELKNQIDDIINSGKLDGLFKIGFYK